MSRRILILGGGSAIALAYARVRATQGCALVLAGRRREILEANAADLTARGAPRTQVVEIDLGRPEVIGGAGQALFSPESYPDEILIAFGSLPDQTEAEANLEAARAAFATNFESPALWLLAALTARPAGKPLAIAVIGSVAGDRGRGSNFIYGAAKGGLARLIEGLQHAYAGSEVTFTLIKPGFVRTPMTAAIINRDGPLWASPATVGQIIAAAVDQKRTLVYAPGFWGPIMVLIRHLPRAVFNRLKL